jgi:hypothetical protein
MIVSIVDPKKANKSRQYFLNLVEDELLTRSLESETKINSQTSKHTKRRYTDATYYEMKEKKLFQNEEFERIFKILEKPRRLSDRIAKMKLAFSRRGSLLKQPKSTEMKKFNKKGVSDRKFTFFRRNTLSKLSSGINLPSKQTVEDVVEYININNGFVHNRKTLQRTEKGFHFLNNLVDRLKLKKEEHTFEEVKKILCLKENIDEESIIEGYKTDKSIESCKPLINQLVFRDCKTRPSTTVELETFKIKAMLSKSCEKLNRFKEFEEDDTKRVRAESDFVITLKKCRRDSGYGSDLNLIKLIRIDSD